MEGYFEDRKTKIMKATMKRIETFPEVKEELSSILGQNFNKEDIDLAIEKLKT